MAITIESTKLLAVEGKDECNFFDTLLKKNLSINDVQIINIGGIDKFPMSFDALCNTEGFYKINRIGFIRDAELNPAKSAFDSIKGVIINKLPTPTKAGDINKSNNPWVGIFIMPDNSNAGTLEHLCIDSIKLLPLNYCIENYIKCIKKHHDPTEQTKFKENKAHVLSYLASQCKSKFVNTLGLAAQQGYWNFNNTCFENIKNFLKNLF